MMLYPIKANIFCHTTILLPLGVTNCAYDLIHEAYHYSCKTLIKFVIIIDHDILTLLIIEV